MKIYFKILLTTIPIVIISIVVSVAITYYLSHTALNELAENMLNARLKDANRIVADHVQMLSHYRLDKFPASIKQAQQDIAREFKEIDIGHAGYVFVLSTDGVVLLHPDHQKIGKDISDQPWVLEMVKKTRGKMFYKLDGVKYIAEYEFYKPWGWYMIATDTQNEVYGAIKKSWVVVCTLCICSALVMALILMYVSRKITDPLRLLEQGAKNIGKGDLNHTIPVSTSDEFGSLAQVFNQMSTELSQTLIALQHSEEHFRSLIEIASDLIMVLRQNGQIDYISPSVATVLGYELNELIGHNFFDYIHPDDQMLSKQLVDAGKSGSDKRVPVEFRFRGQDADWCMLEGIGSRLENDPIKANVVVNARDIGSRKQAEAELAAEKERLAVTLKSIADGVVTTDIGGNVVLMNKVAESLTGWKSEDALHKPLGGIFHIRKASTNSRVENPLEQVINRGQTITVSEDVMLIGKDGSEYIVSYRASPIFDSENQIVGMVLVFKDITEKRKMEGELLKAQKLESIGVLAGGIAHDFNNMLASFMGNVSVAKMHCQPGTKVYEKMLEIEKAVERAVDLTQQLLTFSKGGAPVKKTLSLTEIIKETVIFALRGSNVHCGFLIEENLWPLEADQGQISQVINNMVINSVQAMPQGGIIEIKAGNIRIGSETSIPLPAGNYIKLSIADKGAGIPPAVLDKIFDPYFTTKDKGSGLGLSAAYSIVSKHGGHILVTSSNQDGTIFDIYLPASDKTDIGNIDSVQQVQSGNGMILVMDDEELLREVIGEMLECIGYATVFADNGEQAIEIYKQHMQKGDRIDAVIMDLTIPGGMGGKETIKSLLEIDPDVKGIVSSGYSNDPVMANYRDYGFSGVVSKPYNIEKVSKVLKDIL